MSETAPAPDRLDRNIIVTGLVIVAGMIMVALDTTIVNVALDTLSTELDATLSTTQWVVTGYLLAVALVIPITGWAMDRFGSRAVWIAAISLFVVGSAACAVAWDMESLIAFRVLQGLGGGMLLPCGQAILTRTAGPERLGRAMSIIGVPVLLGPVFGPVLGGVLVDNMSWHWIFLVNVPIGILAIALAVWKLPVGDAVKGVERLDALGLVLLSAGLASVLYGLSLASSEGGFGSAAVIGWTVAGIAALGLYVWHSLRVGTRSIIDVKLFANGRFSAGSVAVFLVGIGMFGGMLLLPLYYQIVRGEDATTAGWLLAPQGVGAIVAMIVAGRLADRHGAGYVVPAGVALALVGTMQFTQVSVDTSYWWLSASLFVRGIGLGAVMMPTIAAAYTQLKKESVSRAAPTLSAMQQVGGSFGGAVLVTALIQHFTSSLADQGIEVGASGSDALTSLPADAMDVVGPVMSDAFGFAFWIALGLTALILIPAMWLPRHGAGEQAQPVASTAAH